MNRCRCLVIGILAWTLWAGQALQAQVDNDLFNINENGAEPQEPPVEDAVDQQRREGMPSPFGFGSSLTPEQEKQMETLFGEGQKLQQEGDLQGAIAKFAEVLGINRNYYPAYLEIGRIQRQLEYLDQAIQSLGTAAALSPSSVEPLVERGEIYMELGRFSQAIVDFQTALSLRPADPDILFQLGLAQTEFAYTQILSSARGEDLQLAIESFDKAIKGRENFADAYFERGSARLQLGLVDEAIEDLTKAVELDPENAESAAQLGFASLRRASREGQTRNGKRAEIVADYQAAVRYFSRYFELAPPTPEPVEPTDPEAEESDIKPENVYINRAAAYTGLGDELETDRNTYYQHAIEDCEAAMGLNEDMAAPYYQMGVAQRMMNNFDGAIESFSEAIARNPTDSESALRRGIIYFRQGNYESAMADFEAASRYQLSPRAKFWAGLTSAQQGDYRRAVTAYNEALRYQPFFTLGYLNRGLAQMKLGRFDRAISDFNEVLRKDTRNQQARSLRDRALQLSKSS